MKVICTQENLKNGLATVGRVISNTNTLPILNNLLIKTESGLLKISSTNLEIAITTQIRCKVEEEGSITVSGKTFIDLINNLPNSNINLQTQNTEMLVETENYHTKIKTLPAEEFPLIPTVEGKVNLSINAQELKTAVDQVVFAASSNQTQPEISGMLVGKDGDALKFAATDRYRLAEKKLLGQSAAEISEVIVPQKTANELSRIIGNQKGNAEIIFSETQIAVNFNDTQLISRLVDGQYPQYKEIIPTQFKTEAVLEKSALISALRTAAVFNQGSNSVKVDIDSGKQQVMITAESADLGKGSVELPAKISGDNTSLILNYHYLVDCLSVLESPKAVMKIIDDNSPSLILPDGKNDYMYLVMPIKS